MSHDAPPVVGHVSESAAGAFHLFDGAVEPFSAGVRSHRQLRALMMIWVLSPWCG
jgi:hypothetical protein